MVCISNRLLMNLRVDDQCIFLWNSLKLSENIICTSTELFNYFKNKHKSVVKTHLPFYYFFTTKIIKRNKQTE